MFKKLLSIALALFVSVTAYAQSGSITGKVTDNQTGEPIIGATVFIESLQKGDQTDVDGDYTVSNVPVGTYEVVISYIGYKSQTFNIDVGSGAVTLDAQLDVDLVGLDEVLVTGFGAIDRQSFTGAASSVSAEKLESVPVASVEQAFQGKISGVTVSSATGTPGAVQTIRIRGISSVNAGTTPLYVIDGVPVVSGSNAASSSTSSLGVLANLSSSDVESITVLKDAVSTAPYGARGTNGVVVITTKSGRSGNTVYSLTAQAGVNTRAIRGERGMSAKEYDRFASDAIANSFGSLENAFGPGATSALVEQFGWDGKHEANWYDVVTNDNALQQEYTLSARGGTDITNFYASGGYFNQEGQTIGTSLDRMHGSLDISHRLDNRIKLTNSVKGSFVEQDGILEGAGYFGSPVLAEFFMLPMEYPHNPDGTANIDNLSGSLFNPIYIQDNDITRKRNTRVMNNTALDINIADNLSFTSRLGLDYLLTEEKYYRNTVYGDADDVQGSVDDITNRNFNYVWQNTLSYIYALNAENRFNFKAITETQKNNFYYLEGYGTGIAAPGLYNLNTTAVPQGVGSSVTDWASQSFTGMVNYGFQNKLFLDANLRYEGSSRFAEDKRWGTFWSVGLGYVLTEEDFLKDNDILNYLKLRASYGKTGNANVSINSYQAVVGFGSYNDSATIQTSGLGNNALTWETANSLDLGAEFELFNKVTAEVTYFRKDSKDLLFSVPLSRTTGHSSQTQNIGALYNQGLEIEANVDIIRTRMFKWNFGANFTALKNEITELPQDSNGEDIEIKGSTQWGAVVGYPVNAWYMKEWAGVDPDNGDPLWYKDDGNGGRTTTNAWVDGDSYYQNASAMPTKFGGINTRFDIENFYVSADLYYSFGNKVYDSWATYMRSDGEFALSFGQYARQADYWTPENRNAENPKPFFQIPINSDGNPTQASDPSSRYLYKGDYLRLKTVNVGYNIPGKYLKDVGLQSASVYFVGQNLWTYVFDDALKFDPEVKSSGTFNLNAMPLKSVTFGVKVNF